LQHAPEQLLEPPRSANNASFANFRTVLSSTLVMVVFAFGAVVVTTTGPTMTAGP
jgi:hypothetical protein